MKVADGWMTQYNAEQPRIRLSLMEGESEIATITFDEDELETLIVKLRDTMERSKAPPRRPKHQWEKQP